MKGRAPNSSLTGFHAVLPRKPKPKARKLGNALIASTTARSATSTKIAKPAAPEPAWKRRSPQDDPVGCRRARRVPRRNGKTMGDRVRAQGRRATPLKVIVRIVVTSRVTTDAGSGAYVRDAAAVCATLSTAHRRKSTSAFAFASVIPLG